VYRVSESAFFSLFSPGQGDVADRVLQSFKPTDSLLPNNVQWLKQTKTTCFL